MSRARADAQLARLGLDAEAIAPTLLYALGLAKPGGPLHEMAPERRRRKIIDVFVRLALDLADKRFVVFSFEDLHFVDRSTLEVVRQLAESPRRARLLLVLTARPEFVPSWPITSRIAQIPVQRLTNADALELIESVTHATPLPGRLVRHLVELGDGIPLVLEELARTVSHAAGESDVEHPERSFRYASSLEDSVARRLDGLGSARDIARVAAVLGRESAVRLLRAVSGVGDEEFKSRLRKLEVAGLAYVRPLGGEACCIFAHTLVQEAIKRTMPTEERRRLETRIVGVLDAQFSELLVARPERFAHLYASASLKERALELFENAARRAAADSAFAEASTHFQAALSLLDDMPAPTLEVERRLRQGLGPCLMATEGWSAGAVADNLRRTHALAAEQSEFVDVWGSWAHGLVTHDAAAVAAALSVANALPPSREQRFLALSTEGVTAFYRGQFARARQYLEQAVAMLPPPGEAISHGSDTLELQRVRGWGCEFLVAASEHLAWMEVLSGRREHAERVHTRAEELLLQASSDPEQSELRHGLYMRVHLGLTLRDYNFYGFDALAAGGGPLHRLFDLAGTRFPYYRNVAQLGEARARAAHGDASALDALLEIYRRVKARSRTGAGHVFFATVIAEACLGAGLLAAADALTAEAAAVADSEFGRFYAPEAHRIRAETSLARGDVTEARSALRQARSACLALDAPIETPALWFSLALDNTEAALLRRARS